MPYRIVVVCLGNICRSPIGAAVLRAKLAAAGLVGEVSVTSAGTGDWHVGGPADDRARTVLRNRSYPDDHCARQFTREDFADADLILGMDAANVRALRHLAPDPQAAARVRLFDDPGEVADPYHGGPADFEAVLEQVERAADALLLALPTLTGHTSGAEPTQEVVG